MNYLPIAADIAMRATRNQIEGARTGAPTPPPAPARHPQPVRARLAAALRQLASALEPVEPMTPGAPPERLGRGSIPTRTMASVTAIAGLAVTRPGRGGWTAMITHGDVEAARVRISGRVRRTPIALVDRDTFAGQTWLKLEYLSTRARSRRGVPSTGSSARRSRAPSIPPSASWLPLEATPGSRTHMPHEPWACRPRVRAHHSPFGEGREAAQ